MLPFDVTAASPSPPSPESPTGSSRRELISFAAAILFGCAAPVATGTVGSSTDATAGDSDTSSTTLPCSVTEVALPGADPYPQPAVAPLCDTGGCWLVARGLPPTDSEQDLLKYFSYALSIRVYHWLPGSVAQAWSIQPNLGTAIAYDPTDVIAASGHLIVAGRTAVITETAHQPLGHFLCRVDVDSEAPGVAAQVICSDMLPDFNPTKLVPRPNGSSLAVSSHVAAGGADAGSTVTLAAIELKGNGIALSPLAEVPIGALDHVSSALPLGDDLVVVTGKRGWCSRMTAAGKVLWTGADLAPEPLSGLASNQHRLLSADPQHILMFRERYVGGKYMADLVALASDSGEQKWQRPLGTGGPSPGSRGRVIGDQWYERWSPHWQDGSIARYDLEWLDLGTGRTVGFLDSALAPAGSVAFEVGRGPAPGLTAYVGVHKPSNVNPVKAIEGVIAAGLADQWGNTTCETSGPCWQKTYADCVDTNPCTSDLCDGAHNGCYHVPLADGVTCSDAGGHCSSGACL